MEKLEASEKEGQDLKFQIAGFNETLEELNNLKEKAAKDEDDIKFLEEQVTYFKQDADQKVLEIQELEEKNLELNAKIDDLKQELFENEEKIADLEEPKENLEQKMSQFKQENLNLRQILKNEAVSSIAQNKMNSHLKGKVQELERKLREFSPDKFL
jgi:chromosome segregation ATPase